MYRIWDNGDLEYCGLRFRNNNEWKKQPISIPDETWISHLKKLVPGEKYWFLSWGQDSFEDSFMLDSKNTYKEGVAIDVFGFDAPQCKECGSLDITANNTCNTCGEWL